MVSFVTAGSWEKDTENCALGNFFGPSYFVTTLIRHSELEMDLPYYAYKTFTLSLFLFLSFSISKKPPNFGYFDIYHFWFKSILRCCAAVLPKCFRFDIKGVSFCMQSRWSSIPDRIGNFPFANVSFRQDTHCRYLDIYISQKIRFCKGDFEG